MRLAILCAAGLSAAAAFPAMAQTVNPEAFTRGDANADSQFDVSDAVTVLGYLFLAGPEPSCQKSADGNDDGSLDLSDAVYLLTALFLAGPPPMPPHPACGSDPTADALTCAAHAPCEFERLVEQYNLLKTVAGRGNRADDVNEWEARFEGGRATQAELSNPHMTMGDDAGNLYIADKEAHAIRKVSPEGIITTVAGTGIRGDDGDAAGPGTSRRLDNPNGLYVRGDGVVYILDLGNGKIRRLDAAGELTTLITAPGGISIGRGLWVRPDEKLAYFCSGTEILRWTPEDGVKVHAEGFDSVGNIDVDPAGNLVATDRGRNQVFRVAADGALAPIAGNGNTAGGGDGLPALSTGLSGVRGVWFLPTGGYFLCTHEGSQVWYVDTLGIIHLFLDGRRDDSHTGDGEHFLTPGWKISEARAVTVDRRGNVIVTENDSGYVRMVERR